MSDEQREEALNMIKYIMYKKKRGIKVAQCKYCSKKGFFLKVSNAGLCNNCHGPVVMSLESIVRVLNDSINLINTSKNFNTKIGRVDLAIEKCDDLINEFWSRGITVFEPNPHDAKAKLLKEKEEMIEQEIYVLVEKHIEKAKRAKTVKTKMSNADKALDELLKFNQEFSYENKDLENSIHAFVHKAQFDDYIENAEKNEFK
ncbi:hypothetical protein [Oceanobacillus saliphilus]|uniref:hypothetical protein n=1 Tax=Oceanobacillus saliphilus TaxID=2925834 RepID=UPI00201E069D|nr:hypothetical protein [Oceanobacillus saliphilus]